MSRITKRVVDALAPGGRDAFAWDDEIKGFGIRCRPSGTKVYVLKKTIKGRTRWFTIGRHGSPWTPETARKKALELLGEIVGGADPAAKRAKEALAATVAELCDLYLAERPGLAPQQKPTTSAPIGWARSRAPTSSVCKPRSPPARPPLTVRAASHAAASASAAGQAAPATF